MGKAIINKESMTFHWLCPCQERREIFLFPIGLYIIAECGSLIQSSNSLIEVSVYCVCLCVCVCVCFNNVNLPVLGLSLMFALATNASL